MNEIHEPVQNPIRPLLTLSDLENLLKLHRRTIKRLCRAGKFPQPMKVGGSSRWKAEDIDQLLSKPV